MSAAFRKSDRAFWIMMSLICGLPFVVKEQVGQILQASLEEIWKAPMPASMLRPRVSIRTRHSGLVPEAADALTKGVRQRPSTGSVVNGSPTLFRVLFCQLISLVLIHSRLCCLVPQSCPDQGWLYMSKSIQGFTVNLVAAPLTGSTYKCFDLGQSLVNLIIYQRRCAEDQPKIAERLRTDEVNIT